MSEMNKSVEKVERPLTEAMKGIVRFLQANDGAHFCADIAGALGTEAKKISPVLTALKKRDLVETSEGQCEVKDKNGNPVTRTYKMYALTDKGQALIIED